MAVNLKRALRVINNKIYPKFLFFILTSVLFRKYLQSSLSSSTINNLNSSIVQNFKIPIPPLEIQNKIVAILDTFTELEKELALRKKQYEYYRDFLLSYDELERRAKMNANNKDNICNLVQWVSLGEVCEVITKQTGFDYTKTIKDSLVTTNQHAYSFIQNKDFSGININYNTDFFIPIEVAQRFKKIILDCPSLLISLSGKIGNVGFFDGKKTAFLGGAICVCKLKPEQNGRFITYFIQSIKGQSYLFNNIKASSHLNITVESIRNFKIPLPPLAVQQEIVSILDTFESLVNDFNSGIPQEIQARKKQYEYYRDRLLHFKELESQSEI